jgi:C-terminal processing protease CtpA/Prc
MVALWMSVPARAANVPADAELDNLVAFARLTGYVRYFHPSDEAASADWNTVTIEGVKSVLGARGDEELAGRLKKIFHPLAPTLQVYVTGKPFAGPDPSAAPAGATRLLAWRHFSVPPPRGKDNYSSQRMDLKKDAAFLQQVKPRIPLPDPSRPLTIELEGKVTVRLPLAVHADSTRTLPPGGKAPALPEGFVPSGKDRATRLAAVILAWNAAQHLYPYFDVIKTDWHAALRAALSRAWTDRDEFAFHSTLRRLVATLKDGHGFVDFRDAAPSFFPPLRWGWIENRIVVLAVAKDCGDIKPGDIVCKIDGLEAASAMARREPELSAATVAYHKRFAAGSLALGARDSQVKLEVQTGAAAPRTVEVRRTLDFARFRDVRPQPRPALTELRQGIWYVDVDRSTLKEYAAALPKLAKAKGIIFDLRGYPRLGLNAPLENLIDRDITGPPVFLPVVAYPDHKRVAFTSGRNMVIAPAQPRLRARATFLTDERAISAAENFLTMVRHYKLGTIFGSPTAGTNGNIRLVRLPGGYTVQFTGVKVVNFDGSTFHGRGVQPDIPVYPTHKGVLSDRDEVLETALSFLVADQRPG